MGDGPKHYLPFSLSLPGNRNRYLTFSDFLWRFGILQFDHIYIIRDCRRVYSTL
ncbi:uncharacterized protein C8R40DRAFT_1105644, partial [Lentinula edodes]|uniref:uncharacterized protein n=1 Tax=Lentinula edodes TaxID=5353 RepID=UPI001E8EA010